MRALRPFEQLPFDEVPELPRAPHPFSSTPARTVDVDGVRTHVRVLGSGPPLLLVHGFMTTSYSFRYVLEPLARHFTVHAPDLVGCGRTDKPERSYAPDRVAAWLRELVRALGIGGCACLGNSLGGYLAMRAALLDPSTFSRIVDLHSPGIPTARMWALRVALSAVPGWQRVLAALVRRDPERWVHRNVHYFDETLKSREEHREYAEPLRSADGVRAFARMLDETLDVREMRRFEQALAERRSFPVPLLLVYAPRDPMVPPSVGARLHALLPDAGYVVLPRGSHFAHVDAPDELLAATVPFLLGNGSTGA